MKNRIAVLAVVAALLTPAALAVPTAASAAPTASASASPSAPDWPVERLRIAGKNRYETAVKISQFLIPDPRWGFGGTLFVANGMNFPDALAVGPAATTYRSPVLLVPPTGPVPEVVREEITRLRPSTVHIVGGEDNVSVTAEGELRALVERLSPESNPRVTRIAGTNRFETSALLSRHVERWYAVGGTNDWTSKTALVANGLTFADSLAGGMRASTEGAPLLLTDGKRLDPSVAAVLTPDPVNPETTFRRQFLTILILGSPASVSSAVEDQIRALNPQAEVIRYSGRDRFETAAMLNDGYNRITGARVYLTNGLRFPDALAASALVRRYPGVTVLTRTECLPAASAATLALKNPGQIIAVGGDDAVSEAALNGTVCP